MSQKYAERASKNEETSSEDVRAKKLGKEAVRSSDVTDKELAAIDEVLEDCAIDRTEYDKIFDYMDELFESENAEELVDTFVQKGGQ